MMAAPVVLVLVAGNAIVERNLAGKSAVRQEFESSVDGRESDVWIFLLDQSMEFVSREMFAGFQKCAQDGIPLTSLLQADPTQMLQKDVLGLAHILARNRGLIVDTLL